MMRRDKNVPEENRRSVNGGVQRRRGIFRKGLRDRNEKLEKPEKIESERARIRKESGRRLSLSIVVVTLLGIAVIYLSYGAVKAVMEYFDESNNATVIEEEKPQPSVAIIDETGSKMISERVKEYVGYMEEDMKALGYEVDRAVLPEKYVREVDIYVKGRAEYYKASLDRGTAVTAEDIVRMIRYLDENGIDGAHYVDVRVSGKAFYQ